MRASDFMSICESLSSEGTTIRIDGGWGVDALLEHQTRLHKDLDIAIQQKDVAKFRQLLETDGYKEIKLETARLHNFVLADEQDHEIDIHVIELDENGNGIYGSVENGEMYPAVALTGIGKILDKEVVCISPEWMVKFHSGYPLKEKDYQDISALCEKFGIALPAKYKGFKKENRL